MFHKTVNIDYTFFFQTFLVNANFVNFQMLFFLVKKYNIFVIV